MATSKPINRRQFLGTAAAASSIATILPRRVLGGRGYVAPSDKINLALVGSGTQSLRMLMSSWLPREDAQITVVCDPNRDSDDYRDWSPHGLRDNIREFLNNPRWGAEKGIRAGRRAGIEMIETYYASQRGTGEYAGCAEYADFREMLDREDGIDAVLVMTPEHLHGTISLAALKKGKHAISHKTLANTFHEVRLLVDAAEETGLVTHLLAWQNDPEWHMLKNWIDAGVIGTVREVHNWSNRPIWPQGWRDYPTEKMKVPKGMDWDLWLGPVPDMPYHIDLTHALFRGWYEFGSGCLGDMGNYSLWRIYRILNPGPVLSVEGRGTTSAEIVDNNQSRWRRTDVGFPNSSTIRFQHKDLDVFWYDGGMKPYTPSELLDSGEELGGEGMLLVGDYGKILGDYHARRFKLIPDGRMKAFEGAMNGPMEEMPSAEDEYLGAIREGRQSLGSFQNVQHLAEATCLGNIAVRMGKRLVWDNDAMRFTNDDDANKLLKRAYRPGWEI